MEELADATLDCVGERESVLTRIDSNHGHDSGQNGPFGEPDSHSSSSAPSRGV
jgi:hypothetical protein